MGVPADRARTHFEVNAPAGTEVVFSEGPADLGSLLPTADYVVMWTAALSAANLRLATKAKLIQKIGEGTDKIDVEAAAELGLLVAKTSGENAVSTAELAVLLMLAALRRLPEAHNSLVGGAWEKWSVRAETYELRAKTVGLVGMGKIATLVSERVRAFGARPIYYKRQRLSPADEAALGVTWVPLDQLCQESDIVSVHVPLNPSTRGMIGTREIALMKQTAILVNTARGDVVDERALIEALQERRIRAAGLDAFSSEPPDLRSPLFQLPNVVVTPHVGGVTEDSKVNLIRHAMANIAKLRAGEGLSADDIVSSPAIAPVVSAESGPIRGPEPSHQNGAT